MRVLLTCGNGTVARRIADAGHAQGAAGELTVATGADADLRDLPQARALTAGSVRA
jgi:hypothetical protein